MWSKPLLCRFQQLGKIQQTQVSQGFAAFRLALSRIPPRHSQTGRDTNFAIPGYSISAMIPRRGRKSKIFLSVVIPVVKNAFIPLSAIVESPANAGVTRLCGVSPHPIPDTTTAHPNYMRTTNWATPEHNYIIPWADQKMQGKSVCPQCGHTDFDDVGPPDFG